MQFVLCLSCNPEIFPGQVFPSHLVSFMVACRCLSVQFVEAQLWHRYPILGRLAPNLTGYSKTVNMQRRFVEVSRWRKHIQEI